MASYWFRCYTEIKRDRKIRRLPVAYRWIWVVLMALAKESPVEGQLFISEDLPLTADDIADEAAVDIGEVEEALGQFKKQNMIYEKDGVYILTNWDDRQFTSDNSTERVRKHRQRKNETLPKRYASDDVTPPEAESRDQKQNTETELKEEGPPPTTSSENECLKILKSVPGYPFSYTKDKGYIQELSADFPTVNILSELKKWHIYKLDHPLKKTSNPRLQLRRWMENAHKWQNGKDDKFDGIYVT